MMTANTDLDDRNSQKTSYFLDRAKRRKLYDQRSEAVKKVDYVHRLEMETSPIDDANIPFVKLLGGNEPLEAATTRWELFNEAWDAQKLKIDRLLNGANVQVLDNIEKFIQEPWDNSPDARVDTAIILPGSNIANHIRLFSQIKDRVQLMENVHSVSITSKACPNLKTALKIIVGKLTESDDGPEEEAVDENNDDLRFDKRLRYDFDILADWCRKQTKSGACQLEDLKVIISVEDADSFDITILTGLIKMTQSYIPQIPIKLMLSVATSLPVFQEKLPRSCIRLLKGRPFHAQMSDGIMKILDETMFTFDKHTLLMGPRLFDNLVHRQRESIESVDAFVSSLKFIFMSHYYSNPFSIFSQSGDDLEKYERTIKPLISKSHIQAIRMTFSFRKFVNNKLANGEIEEVRMLMEDDDYLKSMIEVSLVEYRNYAEQVFSAIDIVIALEKAAGQTPSSKMDLYSGALSSDLWNEPFLAGVIEKAANGGVYACTNLMKALKEVSSKGKVLKDLYDLLESEYSEILKWYEEKPDQEDAEEVSSKMVARVCETLETSLQPYNNFLLYEAFVTDSAKLQEDVFLPTQRPALELALCEPRHYIGEPDRENYRDPHLSILYQLYRESSVFINSYDYYNAFKEMLPPPPEEEDKAEWDKKTLAWFLRGIAELKLLGIVRDSKRKFECVEKIAWKGI